MKINMESLHFKWGYFFWRLSFCRYDMPYPRTLCSYFWMWLVGAPIATAFSAIVIPLAIAGALAIGAAILAGPMALSVWWVYDPFWLVYREIDDVQRLVNTIYLSYYPAAFFASVQLLIWWVAVRKLWLERSFFPETHTGAVIGAAMRAGKNQVCPLIECR